MTSIRRFGWTSLALIALAGCETSNPPATTPPGPGAGTKSETKSLPIEPDKSAEAGKLSDKEIAEIKKLPEAEQAAALAQMTCPVSGAPLGKMGTPIKQTIGDKSFYICCDGCEEEIKSDPKGVLAKLKK